VIEEGARLTPTIAEKWVEQGIEEGIKQGRQEGRQEGQQVVIVRILRRRFGELPAELEGQIGRLGLEPLAGLVDLALEATELAEIEAYVAAKLTGEGANKAG
jgi:flagellar biosynthesis/type III secretory pathway protein FliH